METVIFEFLRSALSDAAKSSLTEKLTVFMIAWFFVKRAMIEHLGKIEQSLKTVADNVARMEITLTTVEEKHAARIETIAEDVEQLKQEVTGLRESDDAKSV